MEATISKAQNDTTRTNSDILAQEVRLVDADGEMKGIVPTREALRLAEVAGLDLVEIVPNSTPPVCKMMDYGKFRYENTRKAKDARKKQKVMTIKEIRLRPTIGQNDYDVKLRSVIKFLQEGDKVKVSLRFRGREIAHQETAQRLFERVIADVAEEGKVEMAPRLEGRQMMLMLAPSKL